MIKEIACYYVMCNRCGRSAQENAEVVGYTEAIHSVEEARDQDWIVDQGHYCDDCWEWDEDENKRVPMSGVVGRD